MPALARQKLLHQVTTEAPPVRGLNTIGAKAAMPSTDAVVMDNFISTDLGLELRGGWREWATGLGGEVRTIMSYEGSPLYATTSPLDQSVLFVATDAGIFDCEGGGDLSAEVPMIALSGAPFAGRMSWLQFSNDFGKWLVACSETDGLFIFDGTTWEKVTAGAGKISITGVEPSRFVQVCAWKKRLMFVERGTTVAWILEPNALGGAAVPFDFGPLMRHGGMLLALINWTQDGGQGVDDYLVVLGTSGDLAVYRGTDPTSAAQFQNVGVWFIGRPPVGRRCFTSSGGNVFVLTVMGLIPVTQIVQGGLDSVQTSATQYFQQLRKIQTVLNQDFASMANTVGWEIMYLPSRALMQIARPSRVAKEHIQYVFEEHNLAWSRLLDVPAVTFGRRLEELYGGTEDGRVLRLFDGTTDGMKLDGSNAQEVRGIVTPAFSYFGNPAVLKEALMMRVNFLSDQEPGYAVHMNVDFQVKLPTRTPEVGQAYGSLWDQALWDQDFWSGAQQAYGQWRSVEGMGYALAASIYIAAIKHVTIANIEYMLKPGGPL